MLICLDAGHGYNTPGKRTPDGIREAEQNYPIMFKVKKYLELNDIDVRCTNSNINEDMPLKTRTNRANIMNADLFISIHKNAIGNEWQMHAEGIETFIYGFGGVAEMFANNVQKSLLVNTGLKDRGVKTKNYHVLRETKMPAILVELGFMDCKKEALQMRDTFWHDIYAKAICKGIANYLNVEFTFEKDDYRSEMFIKATNNLAKKGLINKPDDWKAKDPREYGELWFLMTMFDRISD